MPIKPDAEAGRVPSGRASLPLVRNHAVTIPATERDRLTGLAGKLLRKAPVRRAAKPFGEQVSAGLTGAPAVLFGDQREIGLHAGMPEQPLETRIALLADAPDIIVVEEDCPEHDAYLAELLGLDGLRTVALGRPGASGPRPVAARARQDPGLFPALVAMARTAGACQVIPHYGAGSAWMLAGAISEAADVPVAVASPPPRLTRNVNDKLWFANRVREVLGAGALPPSFAAFGPAGVAARMSRIARDSDRVVVKTPDSAGSIGNVVVDSTAIRGLSLGRIRQGVLSMLRERGWQGQFPLLVGVWEIDAAASPSVQLWIPGPDGGDPIVEGIFEQRVMGEAAEFIGATPAGLAPDLQARLVGEAFRLALLLQMLGYFGRCSLDALVTADGARNNGPLHWIECNGRWGGVSTPMTFVNRLVGNHAQHGLVIVQEMSRRLAVTGVRQAHTRLAPLMFQPGQNAGVITLSGRCLARGAGLHFLALAPTQKEAERLAREAIARLNGQEDA